MERHVRYERDGDQAWLILDRPEVRNALSARAIGELREGLARAEAEREVRVVVLTGEGDKSFCAGGDLGGAGEADGGFLGGHDVRRGYGALLLQLQSLSKPTLARLNGHALAGGMGLVLACDLAVAREGAQLGLPEVKLGLFPMMAMALLQRHVGRKQALELVLTGERIDAEVARGLGLLNRVVPPETLDEEVGRLAGLLADKSQAVMALGRRAFLASEELPLASAMEHLASQLSLNTLAEDAGEGVAAFFEKRPPQWKDR